MSNSMLLKNPILRSKMKANLDNPVGDMIQEIKEQDLGNEAGGTGVQTPCLTTYVTPTPFQKCGYLYTVSAECAMGNPCN